ncbi:hypothetical protein [Pseudomonas fragi]|uniref:hypothetical protein n=1 Tax=Pseudomonas fragi TaxID=296 RepID=UPI0028ED3A32|nr:hypothetical protein [Pseudomonas fragi]
MKPLTKNTAIFESGIKLAIPVFAVKKAEGLASSCGIGTKYEISSIGIAKINVFLNVSLVIAMWIRNDISKNGLKKE